MKRDFTESAQEELLSLVAQVENERQDNKVTDWFGDRWYDFEAWIGKLDVKDYIDDVNTYHRKVIDKNNTQADKIKEIFQNVNTVSTNYKTRLASCLADLQAYKNTIRMIADIISPENGNFNVEYLGSSLKEAINSYLENSKDLREIQKDGWEERQEDIDEEKLRKILATLAATIVSVMPTVKVGDEMEIPIGPGTTVYYKVSAKVEGEGNVDINCVLEEQKLKLKDYSYSADVEGAYGGIGGQVDSDGKVEVDISNSHGGKVTIGQDGVDYTFTDPYDTTTYAYKFKRTLDETYLEETVTTEVDGGSVSSTIGIKIKDDDNGWRNLPSSDYVDSPYTCQLPELDVDWEELVGVTIAIAGALYIVKKIAGVILLVPTYGASSVLVLT